MSWRQCVTISLLLYAYNVNSQYGCTNTDDTVNTCTIVRTSQLNPNNRDNITCSSAYSNCNIQCPITYSCSGNIICPPNGDECIINCAAANACSDSHIITSTSQNVTIIIAAETDNMEIFAPNAGGSLYINIANDIYFQQNKVYSSSNTQNMIINCDGDCSENIIDATESKGDLNISCINSNSICDENTIYCPNECNIFCSHCSDTSIITNNGNIDNIDWTCVKDCSNSSISDINNDATKSWTDCGTQWLLLATNCPTTSTSSTSEIDPNDDDFDQQQFTILAFVLIGTVIGCLCVIVVTTIICCICWHEHQIKALNIQQNKGNNPQNNTNNNNAINNYPAQNNTNDNNAINKIPNGHGNGQYTADNNGHNNNNLHVNNGQHVVTITEHTTSISGSSEASPETNYSN